MKIFTFHAGLKNRISTFSSTGLGENRKFENFPPTLPRKDKNFNFSLCASKLRILTFHSVLKNRNFNVFLEPKRAKIKNYNFSIRPYKSKISTFQTALENSNFNFFLEPERAKIENFNCSLSTLKNRKFTFHLGPYQSKISTFYLTNLKFENFNFSRPLKIVISTFFHKPAERKSKISTL